METAYILKHSHIYQAHFTKNSSDFSVSEIPLYEFTNDGEHLILKIRKKDLTTWDMLKILSEHSGVKVRDFGYAGLKDKFGLTTQYISVLKKYEKRFDNFFHQQVKILDKAYHKNKIKIGHLKQNHFFIRLKKVSHIDALKIQNALDFLKVGGYPNFYGYQRFGNEEKNAENGLNILSNKLNIKDKKKRNFFLSAYQSELFNKWLNYRIELSHLIENFSIKELETMFFFSKDTLEDLKNQKQFLKIFIGDILHHYPHGRAFLCEDVQVEAKRFFNHESTLTGLLLGNKTLKSQGEAKKIEDKIFVNSYQYEMLLNGSRRFAWSFLDDVNCVYNEEKAHLEMNFSLQKGSYATVVLEQLLKRKL